MASQGTIVYPRAGISVPCPTPFYPIFQSATTVKFNQAYLFEYQAKGEKGIFEFKVGGMDEIYNIPSEGEKHFHLEIESGPDDAGVSKVELKEGQATVTEKFHYSAKNFDYTADKPYTEGEGKFQIRVCSFLDGKINELFLRENIHWQKINFENIDTVGLLQDGGCPILVNWGDSTDFSSNPTVKFASIGLPYDKKEILLAVKQEEKGNIMISSNIPDLEYPERDNILYWSAEITGFQWKPFSEYGTQVVGGQKGILTLTDAPEEGGVFYAYPGDNPDPLLMFKPFPSPSEGEDSSLIILGYDGTDLTWESTEECSSINSGSY
jgi:hypothetical protein